MFGLVRDYYVHNDSLKKKKKLSGVARATPHSPPPPPPPPVLFPQDTNGRYISTCFILICTRLMRMVSALFVGATRSQGLSMPTICCCGNAPAGTTCPKTSSPGHWWQEEAGQASLPYSWPLPGTPRTQIPWSQARPAPPAWVNKTPRVDVVYYHAIYWN